MRPLFRIAVAAALCLASLPSLASTQPRRVAAAQADTAEMCRASCLSLAASSRGGLTAQAAQSCSIRCGAAQSYLSQQAVRGSAEATGRGRISQARLPVAVAAAPATAATIRTAYGAIYGGRSPSPAFGMAVGAGDRLAAHRAAEGECSRHGQGCRLLTEFTGTCGAVAQGIQRSQWALVITTDPNTFVVTSTSGGSGATQAQAEQDALAECRSKDRGAQCRVVAAACRGNG
jgi:hypothetical protein